MQQVTIGAEKCYRKTLIDCVHPFLPSSYCALVEKSVSLVGSQKYNDAMGIFDKVLAINPNDAKTLTDKGVFLVALHKYNAAIGLFNKALTIDPNPARFPVAYRCQKLLQSFIFYMVKSDNKICLLISLSSN